MNTSTRSLQIIFLIESCYLGLLFARTPDLKVIHNLNDADLGFAFFLTSLASLLISPFIAKITNIIGMVNSILISYFLLCISMITLLWFQNSTAFITSWIILGLASALGATSMNAITDIVEQKLNKSIMSGVHAFWSIGFIVGSLIGSFSNYINLHLLSTMSLTIIITIPIATLIILSLHNIKVSYINHQTNLFTIPHFKVIPFCIVILVAALIENSLQNWSAIFLKYHIEVEKGFEGGSLVVFSFSMAAIRFFGDKIISRFSSSTIYLFSAISTFLGIVCYLLSTNYLLAYLAMIPIGSGAALLVPVAIKNAARASHPNRVEGVASLYMTIWITVTIVPLVIGTLSNYYNIQIASSILLLGPVLLVCSIIIAKKYNLIR